MIKYTICFIRKDNGQLLMLNRKKSPEMGKWNGVGGKIEENETPSEAIIRETFEETGIELGEVQSVGKVIFKDSEGADDMYVFLADLPSGFKLETPFETKEGILDWKDVDWVIDESNKGVASNIRYYLPRVMNGSHNLEHTFIYNQHQLLRYSFSEMTSGK